VCVWYSWWRSIIVRMLDWTSKLSISCVRLPVGEVIALELNVHYYSADEANSDFQPEGSVNE